jgi:hypothetical protein
MGIHSPELSNGKEFQVVAICGRTAVHRTTCAQCSLFFVYIHHQYCCPNQDLYIHIYNTNDQLHQQINSHTFSPSCSHKRIPQIPTEEDEAEEEEVVVEEVEVDKEEGYDDKLVLLGTPVTNFQR